MNERPSRWLKIALGLSLVAIVDCGDSDGGAPAGEESPETDVAANMADDTASDGDGSDAESSGDPAADDATGDSSSMEGPGDLDLDAADPDEAAAEDDPCSADLDFDGINDCDDECPEDSFKAEPGVCGCGVGDTDIDFDGTLDCNDACELDAAKTEPGACGCGAADVDSDGDDALDCEEGCPFDETRLEPGTCGCGVADDLPLCLRHRYSFDDVGETVTDPIGGADGTLFNTTLDGSGSVTLAGVATDQYVELPEGILSGLGTSATIELWVTWTGAGGPWQRIFDFGSSDLGPGMQGAGATYLFLTPANTIDTHLRLAYTNAGPPAERVASGPTPMPFGVPVQLSVVIDGEAQTLSLYQDGVLLDSQPTLDTNLGAMADVNNWIGRSQFVADEEFQGTLEEFRIYSVARRADEIAASVAAGPDELPEALPTPPEPDPAVEPPADPADAADPPAADPPAAP